jgi:Uma2 family endonuclease
VIQTLQKRLTTEEFRAWYPSNGKRYELIKGEIREVRPNGYHEAVAGFIGLELGIEIRARKYGYTIPNTCAIEPVVTTGDSDTYSPDVAVLDIEKLDDEPIWRTESTVRRGETLILVVEVVSTNWQDDYLTKLRDYEMMGVQEYWVVDYAALGATRYIGSPKQPTVTVYRLIEGEYQFQQYREGDMIKSEAFPDLVLSVSAVLASARV